MTPSDPRVGEIQALAEGLTDLCAEHLRQSIRHVQRNCDIDCNTHEDEPTWGDCKQPDRYDGERMATALASIPRLTAAVDAVLGLADKIAEESEGLGLDLADDDFDRGWHGARREIVHNLRAAIDNALEGE